MYCVLVKEALSVTFKLINKAEKLSPDELVDFFARHRSTFLPQLRVSNEPVKKLIVIGYDRIIIDFLLNKGIKFKIADISVEEIEFGSSIGGSDFLAGVTNVTTNNKDHELAKVYLIFSLFIFNSKNTGIDHQDMKLLIQTLVDIAKINPPRSIRLENDTFYAVQTTLSSYLEQIIKVFLGIALIFFMFKLFMVHRYIKCLIESQSAC